MATPESGVSLLGSPVSSTGHSRLTPPNDLTYPLTPPPPPIFNIPSTVFNSANGLIDNNEDEDEWDAISSEVKVFNAGSTNPTHQNGLSKQPTTDSFAVCYEELKRQENHQLSHTNPRNRHYSTNLSPVGGNQGVLDCFQNAMPTSPTTPTSLVQSPEQPFPVRMLIMPDCDNASWPTIPTRFLKVSQLKIDALPEKLFKVFQGYGALHGINMGKLSSEGVIFVCYYDLRDAMRAQRATRDIWLVQFCRATSNIRLSGDLAGHIADSENEIICRLTPGSPKALTEYNSTPTALFQFRQLLETLGDIYEFRSLNTTTENPTFVVQFYDSRDAWEALQKFDNRYVQGFHVRAEIYRSDITFWTKASCIVTIPAVSLPKAKRNRHDASDNILPNFGNLSMFALRQSSQYKTSDAAYTDGGILDKEGVNRYICTNTSSSDLLTIPPSRMGSKLDITPNGSNARSHHLGPPQVLSRPSSRSSSRGASSSYKQNQFQVPGRNLVDLQNVKLGIDKRTTIMIRNIPNKVDQQMLKDYIDETSAGEYDFLYLRIDFKNLCNVGYAFLNFADPLYIVKFAQARAGTKWNKFNSEKVAEVSYANIQGKEALIEKFRNSSVMDQDPSYRPKIFHSSGPLAGQEMQFPAANNLPRKLRSLAAAQQVGLYNPKHSSNHLLHDGDD